MKYGTMTYLSSNERVLMIKKGLRENDPNSGVFTLPGGNLKDREKGLDNPYGRLEAAVRETEEETGLTLINPRLMGGILFDNHERIFDNWTRPEDFLVYLITAINYTGKIKPQTEEGTSLWVNEAEIDKLPKNVGDEKMYQWLKTRRRFFGVIKHKGRVLDEAGTFVDYLD